VLFLFFQAEDGIRAFHVTGVQTCALPIYPNRDMPPVTSSAAVMFSGSTPWARSPVATALGSRITSPRGSSSSERVGVTVSGIDGGSSPNSAERGSAPIDVRLRMSAKLLGGGNTPGVSRDTRPTRSEERRVGKEWRSMWS